MRKTKEKILIICIIVFVISAVMILYAQINEKFLNKMSREQNNIINMDDEINYKKDIDIEEEYSFVGQLSDGRPWCASIIGDDNTIYGFSGNNSQNKIDIISYDLNSKNFDVIETIDDGFTPIFFDTNEGYVTWVEGIFSYDIQKSRIKLFNKETKEVSIIAELDNLITETKSLALGNNSVYWMDYEIKDNTLYPIINQYNINTRENKVYKRNAASPVICDTFIAYLGESEKNGECALFIDYLKNDKISEIEGITTLSKISGYNDTLLLVYSDNNKNNIGIFENGEITNLLSTSDSNEFQYPQMNDKFIWWKSSTQAKIYDRLNNEIILVDDQDISVNTLVNDNYIITTKKSIEKEMTKKEALEKGMFFADFYVKKLK